MTHDSIRTYTMQAMATFFQAALWGKEVSYLDSVARECFDEIRRIEGQLSIYRSDTDIFELNAVASQRPVTLDPRVFYLLAQAEKLSRETGGAFDITVGPLVRAWGFMGGAGAIADDDAVDRARQCVGMELVKLSEADFSARFLREGLMVDLGAIGKGYALDKAAELIRDFEVPGGLLHGGTSTVVAVGAQPDGAPWPIAIQNPLDSTEQIHAVDLEDNSLSVSAVHGKSFQEGGKTFGHVIDPRSGVPVQNALLAAVLCPSATESDALSTALLIAGESLLDALSARPSTSCLLVAESLGGRVSVTVRGPAFEVGS